MSGFPYINPDNFKRWMKSQNDFDTNLEQTMIGCTVETKFSNKIILKNLEIESGRSCKVAKDFVENGGIIKEVNGNEYLIQVEAGLFYINKKFVIV